MLKIGPRPYKIGITGTIASGKSLVGTILQEAGVPVLDTDKVVGQLYEEDLGLKKDLFKTFGPQIRTPEGHIDKKALRDIVFSDANKRKQLEKMVHPRVHKKVDQFFKDKSLQSPLRAILVPLLFESKSEKLYDEVWAVTVKPEVLVQRLMDREKITKEEALNRIAAQWSQDQKAAKAHRLIDNSGTRDETKTNVLNILDEIQKKLSHAKK